MYLIAKPWTLPERLIVAIVPAAFSWAVLFTLLFLLGQDDLSLEMGIAASGFLALGFSLLLFISVSISGLIVGAGDTFFLFRKTIAISFFAGFASIPLAAFFPLNMIVAVLTQGIYVFRKTNLWRQSLPDETIRLEPVFFAIVGVKVIIALSLLFGYWL